MTAATIAGLLSDEQRLRVFAAVALGASTTDAVAGSAGLSVRDVQSVLPRLVSVGLIEQRDGLRVRTDALNVAALDRAPRQRELPGASPEQAAVLRNFVEDGRLRSIPARWTQRRVVLEYLSGLFEPGVDYAEPQVNELLGAYHDDYATLRRLLADERLLERERGIYRRRDLTPA
jgi:hypothetical protein